MIYVTENKVVNDEISKALKRNFLQYELQLEFKTICTNDYNSQIEFLDVLHQPMMNAKKGFIIRDFVKPTAINRTFLDGRSYHPTHVYKSIIIGEAKRLRRLNENEQFYQDSIDRLQLKCDKSNFNKNITRDMIEKTRKFEFNRKINEMKEKQKRVVWATQFAASMKLNNLGKKTISRSINSVF